MLCICVPFYSVSVVIYFKHIRRKSKNDKVMTENRIVHISFHVLQHCFAICTFLHFKNVSSNMYVAKWSRGMIPALGAGGPGFKSRFGPYLLMISYRTSKLKIYINMIGPVRKGLIAVDLKTYSRFIYI